MPNSHRNALLTTAATPAPLPWRDRPVVTVDMAADLLGCSRGNIYKRGAAGALDLLRLAGRTVVSVPSIIRLLDSAQRRTQSLRLALDDQQKEMAKLTERAELASEEYTRGRAKLLAAGGQLRRLASTARSLEDKLAACVDDVATVRLRHGGTDAHAGVVTLAKQAAAEAVAQRATVEKHLRKVANLVPV